MKQHQTAGLYSFLRGGGEMGELIRNSGWSNTQMGTPDQWPLSLRISLSNLLNTEFPMLLVWGEELRCFCNDAFLRSFGKDGNCAAPGEKGKEAWIDIWEFIGPLVEGVLNTGQPVWLENVAVPLYRDGRLGETYWSFNYSLLVNDDGEPGGVLVACLEKTAATNTQLNLQQSDAKLRSILNSAPAAIGVFVGAELIVENPNQLFIEVMGVGSGIEGLSLRELLPGLVEKDHEFIALIDKVRLSGKPLHRKSGYFSKKSRRYAISISALSRCAMKMGMCTPYWT